MSLVLSDKELGKLFVIMLLAAILFGVAGLLGILVMQWVTRQRYAKEDQEKHGISQVNGQNIVLKPLPGLVWRKILNTD